MPLYPLTLPSPASGRGRYIILIVFEDVHPVSKEISPDTPYCLRMMSMVN
jgi:hypothetical protein